MKLNLHETYFIINNPDDINLDIGNVLKEISEQPDLYKLTETDLNEILLEFTQNSEQNNNEIDKSSNDQAPHSHSKELSDNKFSILNEILNSKPNQILVFKSSIKKLLLPQTLEGRQTIKF